MSISRLFNVLGRQADSARVASQRVSSSSVRGTAMKTMVFVLLLAVVLSACAPAVTPIPATAIPPTVFPANTATPSPQPTASPAGPAPWSLVAVGDSLLYNSSDDCPGCISSVDRYADSITKATGHPVNVQNLSQHNGLQTDGLLDELKTDVQRRDALANADIIIVSIGVNDTPFNRDDDPCDGDSSTHIDWSKFNPTCAAAAAEIFRPKLESVFAQIVALRAGKPTIFRTITPYNDWLGGIDSANGSVTPPEATNPTRDVYDAWSAMICKAAQANGFTCADTYHAFNGPDGLKPIAGDLTASKANGHPSDKGNEVIARTLADLGYAPLAPAATAAPIPTLSIQPPEVLIDQPVSIRLSGFEPNQEITLRATTVGRAFPDLIDSGKVYESFATFKADRQGTVDVDKQVPLSGTYETADGMGLFWSMVLKPDSTPSSSAPTPPNLLNAVQYHVSFSAEVNGKPVAKAAVVQNMGSASVVVKEVAENGVLGQFYQPAGKGPFPAVIALVGSQGGLLRQSPKVLAAEGYAVLSLAYFNYTSPLDNSSLPDVLDMIPMEYFGKAIRWLQSQPGVDPKRIGMIGFSAGGTAALLAGTIYPQIKTVIAFSAPTYTWDGDGGGSSFSYQGKPVPFASSDSIYKYDAPFTTAVNSGKDPMAVMPSEVASIKADTEIGAAIIPVEKIKGSVLLISGDRDSQLSGPVYGELAVDRLKAHNFSFPYRHIMNPGAGHLISFPYAQRSIEIEQGGGSPQANAQAAAVIWPVVLEYLAAMK
jgi:lysophospholipase L1-like esterase